MNSMVKVIVSIVALFGIFSIGFADTIAVDQPYSSGKIVLRQYNFQDQILSNGLQIHFSKKIAGNAETASFFTGIVFDNFKKAGYNHHPSVKQATFKANLQNSIVYYPSTDTIWANSRVFPDSLIPLDTIIDDTNWNGQATVKKGRYFLQSFSTIESPAIQGMHHSLTATL